MPGAQHDDGAEGLAKEPGGGPGWGGLASALHHGRDWPKENEGVHRRR